MSGEENGRKVLWVERVLLVPQARAQKDSESSNSFIYSLGCTELLEEVCILLG